MDKRALDYWSNGLMELISINPFLQHSYMLLSYLLVIVLPIGQKQHCWY